MYFMKGKQHLTFLLHWRDQHLLLRRLFVADRWEYKKWEGARNVLFPPFFTDLFTDRKDMDIFLARKPDPKDEDTEPFTTPQT
jgi:hypothetical protein